MRAYRIVRYASLIVCFVVCILFWGERLFSVGPILLASGWLYSNLEFRHMYEPKIFFFMQMLLVLIMLTWILVFSFLHT